MVFSPMPISPILARMTGRTDAVSDVQTVATRAWRYFMFARWTFLGILFAFVCAALAAVSGPALAISVEVAKKCNALIVKEFPPREPGNPAAGSAKGSGQVQRAFFSKCVANGGKMDDNTAK